MQREAGERKKRLAEDFPGVPEDGAQTVRRTAETGSRIAAAGTVRGCVRRPGRKSPVSAPGAPKDSCVSARIGCHTDSLHQLDEWKRVPEITMQVPAARSCVNMGVGKNF